MDDRSEETARSRVRYKTTIGPYARYDRAPTPCALAWAVEGNRAAILVWLASRLAERRLYFEVQDRILGARAACFVRGSLVRDGQLFTTAVDGTAGSVYAAHRIARMSDNRITAEEAVLLCPHCRKPVDELRICTTAKCLGANYCPKCYAAHPCEVEKREAGV